MSYKDAVRFKILVYGLVWIGCTSVSKGNSPRIIGGYKAPKDFGRFHASLQNLTGHHVCGSAVISSKHLLTAAHCVNRVKPKYIKVVVGTTDLDEGGKEHAVKNILIHRRYNTNRRANDIAIVKIKGVFDLKYAYILKLPETQLQDGDPIILSGFGAREAYGISSRQMYGLNKTVFCQKTCRFAMRYFRKLTDTMFCTFTKIGEGTCHGDSGGPLIKNNTLVGIVSWGIPCAVGFPDVHTRIYPYRRWIQSNIQTYKSRSITIEVKTKVKLNLEQK